MRRRVTLERILPRSPETRRLVLAAVGLFFGSAAITLIILLAGGGTRGRAAEAPPELEPAVPQPVRVEVGIGDLLLPDALHHPIQEPALPGGPPYLLRAPMSRWAEEQVRRYWVPLEEIAIEELMQENDRRIEELFEEVP